MKTVIFKAISLQTIGTATAPGFSVPVDANTYVDFRMGIKYM
jgi:hypothetical protein